MGGESVKTNSCMGRYLGIYLTSSTGIVFTIIASRKIQSQVETRFTIAALKYGLSVLKRHLTKKAAFCV
jgi:hypothetical protein